MEASQEFVDGLLDKAEKLAAVEKRLLEQKFKLDWIRHYLNATRSVTTSGDADKVELVWVDEESRRQVCFMYRGETLREEIKRTLER